MAYKVVNGKLVRKEKVGKKGYKGYNMMYDIDTFPPGFNKTNTQTGGFNATDHTQKMPSNKGQYQGACNRSACLAPGANWYNRGSYAFYCEDCAYMLSEDPFNRRDAEKLFGEGQKLCYEVTSEQEALQLHVSTRV